MSEFKKNILRSGGIIGIIIVLFAIFFLLFRANILHQLDVIKELAERRNTYSHSSQGLAVLIKDWDVAQQYKDRLQLLVPKKDDIVLLSKELQARAQKDRVSIVFSFNAESETKLPQGDIGSIGFTATIEGAIKDILLFLNEIEESYYALQIQTFDLSTGITNNASLSRFFITGKVFFH